MTTSRTTTLADALKTLYQERSDDMLFHGWHHIYFVAKKAVTFARELGVETELVEAAALTHDLNYVVSVNSEPEAGKELRANYLQEAGFSSSEITNIEDLVMQEHTATRHKDISDAAKALSDADTLFKALPVTPIIFAGHFITENNTDIQRLAAKVVREQRPLMDGDIYFYTSSAKAKYMKWAQTNLVLWENVQEALRDADVSEMLQIAREFKAI
jgi:uncharacterized protein